MGGNAHHQIEPSSGKSTNSARACRTLFCTVQVEVMIHVGSSTFGKKKPYQLYVRLNCHTALFRLASHSLIVALVCWLFAYLHMCISCPHRFTLWLQVLLGAMLACFAVSMWLRWTCVLVWIARQFPCNHYLCWYDIAAMHELWSSCICCYVSWQEVAKLCTHAVLQRFADSGVCILLLHTDPQKFACVQNLTVLWCIYMLRPVPIQIYSKV